MINKNEFEDNFILLSLTFFSAVSYFGYISYFALKTDIVQVNTGLNNEEILKKELEKKDEEIKNITSKIDRIQNQINDYQSQIDGYKKQLSSKDAEISSLKKEVSSKNSNIDKLSSSVSKQEACNKMNEYSQLSSDLKFRYGGAGDGEDAWRRCTSSISTQVGSNTENAFDYVSGWYDNYKNTGNIYFKHNPDLCLDDVENNFTKLKDRRDKYREYKKKCEAK